LLIVSGIAGPLTDACAQGDLLPPGIYMNIEELKARRPAMEARLQVTRRSGGDIAMMGGNDYRIQDPGDSLTKKLLKREVFAYMHNDSLFLNCAQQQLGPWYSLVVSRGEFLVFSAAMTADEAMSYGALGGAIGGAIAAGKRYLYILSLKTGTCRKLTKEYLIARFKDRGKTDLLARFNAETAQDWDHTLLQYAELLNASLADGGTGVAPEK
jgi:hypothetical protein